MRRIAGLVLTGLILAGCSGEGMGGSAELDGSAGEPQSFSTLFGTELVNTKAEKVAVTNLVGKKVGVYFSAHWCPPCRSFTPVLVSFHEDLKKAGKPFEIVFVSSDRTKDDMSAYMKDAKMPWLAIPFDSPRKSVLSQKYGVRGIPSLIILDPDGKVLSKDGRRDVMELGVKAFDKW